MDISTYFKKSELIPAVVQENDSGQVLMLAYMNRESLKKTIETGYTWFYSRSRGELWNKGAESGNFQKVCSITPDCDDDALLVKVIQTGVACHTGEKSCFYNKGLLYSLDLPADSPDSLKDLYNTIQSRKEGFMEKSYTCYLFAEGLNKILKKCGEECSEVIIAAKEEDELALSGEICDLLYHILVLMVEKDIPLERIYGILDKRKSKIGNLKPLYKVDHDS
jgi:phosphoribosyl-ATP pyrophosphohydrolase/phosphoribosyl-AMP cyclohydrolase